MHPLVDLTDLNDKQLEEKVQSLSKKYFMPMSAELRNQLIMMLDTYKMELHQRRMTAYEEQFQKSNDKGLDKLVNIN
jgi:hypothetical protein